MPEKPLTIATYAAGASLAAITLVYVFGPTFFLDDEAAQTSRSARRKGVVGLVNPANDCFINSVLQALAGLPDLRAFLIREVHRRTLDGPELYNDLTAARKEAEKKPSSVKKVPEWQTIGLQQGLVTIGLKEVVDALNERPIYKKSISAQNFIRCVELAFRTRISRTQQDAQEFLQIIVERVAEEYYAGKRVRQRARNERLNAGTADLVLEPPIEDSPGSQRDSKLLPLEVEANKRHPTSNPEPETQQNRDPGTDEDIFPLQGKLESQVECSYCHFKPKASVSSFLTLTVHLPHQRTSATLHECFDGILKIEHIEDFKCDRCRLEHAISINERLLAKSSLSEEERESLESDHAQLQQALTTDPEKPPTNVRLPDLSAAPKRKITRHTQISTFPKILSIHLSRSVWDPSASSSKNQAKVSFPESLPLGGLLNRKSYRLLGVVTHKGGHNSGHYESFRRQILPQPFSTPVSLGREGVFSVRNSPASSAVNSPRLSAKYSKDEPAREGMRGSPTNSADSTLLSTPTSATPTSPQSSVQAETSTPSAEKRKSAMSTLSISREAAEQVPSSPLQGEPSISTVPDVQPSDPSAPTIAEPSSPPRNVPSLRALRASVAGSQRKKKISSDRWWRISDEKVKECKTSDVLGMQREVYMLFYEMVDEGT